MNEEQSKARIKRRSEMTEEEKEAFDSVVYYQVDGDRSGMEREIERRRD